MLNLLKFLIFGHIHHWVITKTYEAKLKSTTQWYNGAEEVRDHRVITIQQACSKCGKLRITRTELL
jgi:hypothetical protein